jgi:pimeloyl-ACP methyl ester carboxylesterase
VHFIHERDKGDDPLPLVLTHGWPSTFFEFSKIILLLTDPESPGGDAADTFDVVVTSLPGYGFSDHPRELGFSRRIPGLWVRLMEELGYRRFAAHGVGVGRRRPVIQLIFEDREWFAPAIAGTQTNDRGEVRTIR